MLLSVATHCPDHLWNRPADDPPPTTPPPPPALITADSLFGLCFHSEDKRFAVKRNRNPNTFGGFWLGSLLLSLKVS